MKRLAALLAAALPAACVEQPPPDVQAGTLVAAAPAQQAGEDSGAGAAAGLVLGAAAGGALGRGAGRALGAAIGAAAGGIGGAAAESAGQSTRGAAYTVRLSDGQVLTIIQHLEPGETFLQPGQAVRVRTIGRMQRVEAAS